ncbi:TolC family protein, partial [Alienimonas chondri]|uniref:TolC family protein n=1 Tax=Alienimonas chondri TaxID=2681879 RepID=UPI0019D61E4D
MSPSRPAARRLRRAVAVALLGGVSLGAFGCGGGRWLTTHTFGTSAAPPPASLTHAPHLASSKESEPQTADRVTPASFLTQERAAEEGGADLPRASPGSAPGETDPELTPPGFGSRSDAGNDAVDPNPNPSEHERSAPESGPELRLEDVTASVLATYPLLADAALGRPLADGQVLEAEGAFDTKLKGSQELAPLGFYENYRHSAGVEQPLVGGADLFAGYRIGRGEFEPWYQERQTNDGGEFKAGFTVPLLQDRRIDARRAALRVAALERAAADPAVATAQLDAVRNASTAYWEWVLAGRLLTVAERLLDLSLNRTEGLEAQVERGEKAEIALQDNDRLIAARRSKVIDAERKFRQSAAKLSLYLRDPSGMPLVPGDDLLPARFPSPGGALPPTAALVAEALSRRPELATLRLSREQALVALSEARNGLLPELDAGLAVSQDVGGLSSKKGDKQPFELDTALILSVPLQRRKARGKAAQSEAKLARLSVKQRFAADKAAVEVQLAVAALEAARRQIEQAEISVELAQRLQAAEVRAFDLGESDLLILNLREAASASASETLATARFAYWLAVADLAAATAASPAACRRWASS